MSSFGRNDICSIQKNGIITNEQDGDGEPVEQPAAANLGRDLGWPRHDRGDARRSTRSMRGYSSRWLAWSRTPSSQLKRKTPTTSMVAMALTHSPNRRS